MSLMEFIESNWFQITLIATIVIFVIKITRKIDGYINVSNNKIDDLKEDTNDKINKINERLDRGDEKRLEGQERTKLIMQGVEATLISLRNDGHNGPVTDSLIAINEYKTRKASE